MNLKFNCQAYGKPIPIGIMTVLLLLCLLPDLCHGCTPIMVGLFFLGPTLFGSLALSSVVGIFLAVIIKIIVFLIVSDYRSIHVVWMMIIANVVSTAIGIGIALSSTVPIMLIVTLPIAFVCFLPVAMNFHRHKIMMKSKPVNIAIMLTVILFVNIILYAVAQGTLDFSGSMVIYWILKILASILAMGLTLLFSVVLEEAVIAAMYKKITKDTSDKNFLKPVLWANIIAFLIVFGLAAAKSLPMRLRTPGFLNPGWQ